MRPGTESNRSAPNRRRSAGRAPFWARWVLLAAMAGADPAWAQNYRARYVRIEEPDWFKLRVAKLQLGAYAEREYERTSLKDSDTDTTYERSFIAPSVWWELMGSVYHPNFLRYSVIGDGAYGWSRERTDSGSVEELKEMQRYGHVLGNADFLSGKPVSGAFYGSYGRSYREYDFFNRTTVESDGYGTRWAGRGPNMDVVAAYSHADSEELDSLTPYASHQDIVSLDARKRRQGGASSINYTMNRLRYSNAEIGSEVTDHTVTLTDGGTLGNGSRITYGAGAGASHHESDTESTDQLSANAAMNVSHRYNLDSTYGANYDRISTDGFDSDILSASAGVRHQLYQSLASSLSVNGSEANSSSDTESDGETRQYGATWGERYTKRLGALHRLQLDHTLSAQHVDQAGGRDRAINERHTFPTPPNAESFLLDLPDAVESSLVIRDAQGLRQYVRGIDYEVLPAGSRLEIRRIRGGSIPEGATVLADYRAAPARSGRYEAMTQMAGGRLYLWHNLWQIYGRLTRSRNNAGEDLHAPEVTSRVAGTELQWATLQAGVEYEDYETDDTTYHSTRFFESAYFNPDEVSSLSVSLSQGFIDHVDSGRDEEDYRFITRYRRSFTYRLQGSAEGGLDVRRGEGVDETARVLRAELQYLIGRTYLQASYDMENNDYLNREERTRNRFTLTLKRDL